MARAPFDITRRAAIAWALCGAGARANELPTDVCTSRKRVVATTSDLASLVAAVGGELVQVQSVVSPLADAETFEQKASDLALIANAQVVVRVGLGYDHWLEKLLERRAHGGASRDPGSVVDASTGVPLLEVQGRDPFARDAHAHGLANPHYWLDPANAVTMTATIGAAIASGSRRLAEAVQGNRAFFLQRLRGRMDAWAHTLAPYRGTAVLAYHNSWPYLARRFHLNVVGFIEPREGVSPSAAHLWSLLLQARQSNARAILQKANEPKRFAETIAARLGIPLVQLAPAVGSVPQAKDYLGLMDYNIDALARGLGAAH